MLLSEAPKLDRLHLPEYSTSFYTHFLPVFEQLLLLFLIG